MAIIQVELTVHEAGRILGSYRIGPGQYVIGRDDFCGIQVDSNEVSRMHALLTFSTDELFIEDLGSSNGTLINGALINTRTKILPGQQVELGAAHVDIRLLDEAEAMAAPAGSPAATPVAATSPSSSSPALGTPQVVAPPASPAPAPAASSAALQASGTVTMAAAGQNILREKKYSLGTKIAEGGMGTVIQVEDMNIRRNVAMKVMLPEMQGSREDTLRFVEEAQVMGQLEHPSIVPIYDLGVDEQGRFFYTMKFVKGTTMEDVLENIKKGDAYVISQYPLNELLIIYEKICQAVAFAHSKGVVHRDLKPENMMIGDYGEVLVMDWGLAKVIGSSQKQQYRVRAEGGRAAGPAAVASSRTEEGDTFRTMKGVVMGTPHFMAPEQAEGRVDEIDERTDIYALGGILYNVLTLNPPITGRSLNEVLGKVVRGGIRTPSSYNTKSKKTVRKQGPVMLDPDETPNELPHLTDGKIPEALSAIAMKALSTRPEDRYQSVKELQKEIESYKSGFATSAEQASRFKQFMLLVKRRKMEFIIASAATLLFLVVIISSMLLLVRDRNKAVIAKKETDAALKALKTLAPTIYTAAKGEIAAYQLPQALEAINYAIKWDEKNPDYHNLRGNILQTLLRLSEAKESYKKALELNPNHKSAKLNLDLTEKILKDNERRPNILPASKHELRESLAAQGRTEEAYYILRQLGTHSEAMIDTFQKTLDKFAIKGKIQKGENNQLYLNLANTTTDNLAPLKNIPLAYLNLENAPVVDLTPLKGMPLNRLNLKNTQVTDVSTLLDCKELEILTLPTNAQNVETLRQHPTIKHISFRSTPDGTPAQTAEQFWKEFDENRKR